MENNIEKGLSILQTLLGYEVFRFDSKEEWSQWRSKNPAFFSTTSIQSKLEKILSHGVYSAWLGLCPREKVRCNSPNIRESLNAGGFNPRQRAVLDMLAASFLPDNADVAVYAPEAITRFAEQLSSRFGNFTGSEYISDPIKRSDKIRHEDLAQLKFGDRQFGLVVVNEVFEHLPFLEESLSEIARILTPKGSLIATFPFITNREASIVKARIKGNGEIQYFAKPEYHGNPIEPEKGSLVFQIPAWDIISIAKRTGFRKAQMILMTSLDAGVTSSDVDGILVFVAYR